MGDHNKDLACAEVMLEIESTSLIVCYLLDCVLS